MNILMDIWGLSGVWGGTPRLERLWACFWPLPESVQVPKWFLTCDFYLENWEGDYEFVLERRGECSGKFSKVASKCRDLSSGVLFYGNFLYAAVLQNSHFCVEHSMKYECAFYNLVLLIKDL